MNPDVAARAEHWLEVGQAERCLEVLQQAGEPDSEVFALTARALHRLERWHECAGVTQRGLDLDPTDLELRYRRAIAIEKIGDVAQAERLLLSCLADEPRNVVVLTSYADLLVRHGQLAQAERVLARAANEAPGAIVVELSRCYLALANRRDQEALEAVRRVLAQDPGHRGALGILGNLEQDRGRSAEAARRLRAAALMDLGDRELAQDAREARRQAGWIYLPLRLVRRLPEAAVLPVQLAVAVLAVILTGQEATDSLGLGLVVLVLLFTAWFWIAVLVARSAARRNR